MKFSARLGLVSLVLLIGALIWWLSQQRSETPTDPTLTILSAESTTATNVAPNTNSVSQPHSQTPVSMPYLYPRVDRELIRSQVQENPHGTPQGLTDFASGLAVLIREAQSGLSQAEAFATDLEDCALNENLKIAESARALCLINIQRLSNAFPGSSHLQSQYEKVNAKVPPRIREIAKAVSFYGSH